MGKNKRLYNPNETADTATKILRAAAKVFSEHGYNKATTRMICAEAKVNVALVNYHFHSKAALYKEVVKLLFQNTGEPMLKIPESVVDHTTWQIAIRFWIGQLLDICAACEAPGVWGARLLGMEECLPSDLTKDVDERFSKPVRQAFISLLRMGARDWDELELGVLASSIAAQCMIYAFTKRGWEQRFCPAHITREVWLERVKEHICASIFEKLHYQGS